MLNLILLFVAFQLKHYVCDYVIQMRDPYYNRKFDLHGWFLPLTAHCASHFYGTLFIVWIFLGLNTELPLSDVMLYSALLSAFDFAMHFSMDRVKSSPHYFGMLLDQTDYRYWLVSGFDQMFHHLTHYVIIFTVLYLI